MTRETETKNGQKVIVKYLTTRQYQGFAKKIAVRVLIDGTWYLFRPKAKDRALEKKIMRLKKALKEAQDRAKITP